MQAVRRWITCGKLSDLVGNALRWIKSGNHGPGARVWREPKRSTATPARATQEAGQHHAALTFLLF
jgi:hypothetical protein